MECSNGVTKFGGAAAALEPTKAEPPVRASGEGLRAGDA